MDINFEAFIEWDNTDHFIERFLSKAQKTTLTLSLLQQQAHITRHVEKAYIWK